MTECKLWLTSLIFVRIILNRTHTVFQTHYSNKYDFIKREVKCKGDAVYGNLYMECDCVHTHIEQGVNPMGCNLTIVSTQNAGLLGQNKHQMGLSLHCKKIKHEV